MKHVSVVTRQRPVAAVSTTPLTWDQILAWFNWLLDLATLITGIVNKQ